VVRGDLGAAIFYACSSIPLLQAGLIIDNWPAQRNVWQQVEQGRVAASARHLIIAKNILAR
jgi:hypothetical protein